MLEIRFINLDRATERRGFMEAQGQRLPLPLQRVRAVHTAEIDPLELARIAASWQRPITPGEVACFLSHRREWERIAERNEPAVVLEDDAVLSPHLRAVVEAAAQLRDVDLLNLEDFGKRRFLQRGRGVPLADGIRRVRSFRDKAGTAAYILWPAAARRLLALTETRGGPSDAVLHGAELRSFVCEPAVAMQLSFLEELGLRGEIDGRSMLQLPRARRFDGWRYAARRFRAQLSLLRHHARRVTGSVSYRRVERRESDFI